jgi:hypothetical protein
MKREKMAAAKKSPEPELDNHDDDDDDADDAAVREDADDHNEEEAEPVEYVTEVVEEERWCYVFCL